MSIGYVGPYANAPMYAQPGTGPLYNYNTGSPAYGLYGQNPQNVLAESSYARMTDQWTSLSSAAIPNLASFTQPMMVDMNGFTGNTGIPMLPSFIGATSMMNPEQPLYNTYADYQNQQYAAQMANMGYNTYPPNNGYATYPPTTTYPPNNGYATYPPTTTYPPNNGYATYPPNGVTTSSTSFVFNVTI